MPRLKTDLARYPVWLGDSQVAAIRALCESERDFSITLRQVIDTGLRKRKLSLEREGLRVALRKLKSTIVATKNSLEILEKTFNEIQEIF